jgi:hypothetical protein
LLLAVRVIPELTLEIGVTVEPFSTGLLEARLNEWCLDQDDLYGGAVEAVSNDHWARVATVGLSVI